MCCRTLTPSLRLRMANLVAMIILSRRPLRALPMKVSLCPSP